MNIFSSRSDAIYGDFGIVYEASTSLFGLESVESFFRAAGVYRFIVQTVRQVDEMSFAFIVWLLPSTC